MLMPDNQRVIRFCREYGLIFLIVSITLIIGTVITKTIVKSFLFKARMEKIECVIIEEKQKIEYKGKIYMITDIYEWSSGDIHIDLK